MSNVYLIERCVIVKPIAIICREILNEMTFQYDSRHLNLDFINADH